MSEAVPAPGRNNPPGIFISEEIVGTDGEPANQNIPSIPHNTHLGPGSIDIVPASPTGVGNCIPFGNNTSFGFTGFIYRNVPAFNLAPGTQIAFDLGSLNDVDTRRNIYFAVANINPAPPIHNGFDITSSQGITALGWTQVVSDTQVPQNPKGNFIKDDYELIYTSEVSFSFPGGGLIVGFGGSPPGAYADFGCEQVLVATTSADASGNFYSRFFLKPDQTLDVLDSFSGGGTALAIGGIVIGPSTITVDIDIKPGSDPNSINLKSKGVIPVAILTTDDFDAADVAPPSSSKAPARTTAAATWKTWTATGTWTGSATSAPRTQPSTRTPPTAP